MEKQKLDNMSQENKTRGHYIQVHLQFLKDLSFEVNGHYMNIQHPVQPEIKISFDVNVIKFDSEEMYDVTLGCKAESIFENKPIFLAEIQYCGRVSLSEALSDE